MRKNILFLFCLIIVFFTVQVSYSAVETDKSKVWGSDTNVFNAGFSGQEPVTDNKLNKTIKMLKERSLSNKQRKVLKEVQPIAPQSAEDYLQKFVESEIDDTGLNQTHTIMIPMQAYSEEGVNIPPGYYKLSCRKLSDNEYVLDLTQGAKRVLSVRAKQTKQDLEQESITFCDAEIIDNNRIRLIYGSIELNLVGYLYFN